jgi:hypothetical protein
MCLDAGTLVIEGAPARGMGCCQAAINTCGVQFGGRCFDTTYMCFSGDSECVYSRNGPGGGYFCNCSQVTEEH